MPVSLASSQLIYDALTACEVQLISALPETWLVHLIRLAEEDPAMTEHPFIASSPAVRSAKLHAHIFPIGRFTDDDEFGLLITDPEHGVAARLAQTAGLAAGHGLGQIVPTHPCDGFDTRP